jgi:hypothetical protein
VNGERRNYIVIEMRFIRFVAGYERIYESKEYIRE